MSTIETTTETLREQISQHLADTLENDGDAIGAAQDWRANLIAAWNGALKDTGYPEELASQLRIRL
jgi:hypothetical protein